MSETPPILQSPPDREVVVDGRRYLYFGGTAYLGLQSRPEVLAAGAEALQRYGLHAATTRSGFGVTPPLQDVEREVARFFGTQGSLHLPSGWLGAALLLESLRGRSLRLFVDEHAHPALQEAAAASGAPRHPFPHRDPDALRVTLRRELRAGESPLLLTDGVFAIAGTAAPLRELAALAAEHQGLLLVDDAHGVGVLGAHGRGTLEHANVPLTASHVLCCATLSKALGGYGGVIPLATAGLAALPIAVGATPAPAPVLAASARALQLARAEPELRARLHRNSAHLRTRLRARGLDVPDLPTPIISLQRGDADSLRLLHQRLRAAGILVPYLAAYPGAGPHGALRIAVTASHTTVDLDTLADHLLV